MIIMDVSVITAWGVGWMGLSHSPKTDSDRLIKDSLITLTIHYDQQLHTAIIQYFSTIEMYVMMAQTQ